MSPRMKGVEACFLGTEENNADLLKSIKWVANPELEFFREKKTEEVIAIVRGNAEVGGNRVYRVQDVRLIQVLRLYAEASKSWITFYKKKLGSK